MKSVENAKYLQIDHRVEEILRKEGVVILPSQKAWEKFEWSREYFGKKPDEGFFVWVTKQIPFPISTCVTISSENVEQNMMNLVVIEEGIKVKSYSICNASSFDLHGRHNALGKIILKKGSKMELLSTQSWGSEDVVEPTYYFILEENSMLDYKFKSLNPPKRFVSKNVFELKENAKVRIEVAVKANNSYVELHETTYLNGKNADAVSKLRVVSDKKSEIIGYTKMVANAPSKGHLDCQGLMLRNDSRITLIPALENANKEATLTHEASIGRITEDVLNYLMTRGLTEEEAIDLIVTGFLS
ncbi:MAG: SufD family Fe-S cluster assembly protein [Candidatus Aenigmarchaeota archaeon]|nr:SufD family Fe-S cluster assembly protein [Candidatus Aenigmarchaeota archaeon]